MGDSNNSSNGSNGSGSEYASHLVWCDPCDRDEHFYCHGTVRASNPYNVYSPFSIWCECECWVSWQPDPGETDGLSAS